MNIHTHTFRKHRLFLQGLTFWVSRANRIIKNGINAVIFFKAAKINPIGWLLLLLSLSVIAPVWAEPAAQTPAQTAVAPTPEQASSALVTEASSVTPTPKTHNQSIAATQPPVPASAPLDARGAVIKTLGGLFIIVAVILGCAFVTKKWLIQPFSSNNTLQLVAQLTLGPKEKIAIIDVAGQQLVVGITAYNIRTLMELSQPIALEKSPVIPAIQTGLGGDFAKKLQELMTKGKQP